MTKCTNSYYHYKVENDLINNNIINSKCLRYSKTKLLHYVIICKYTLNQRRDFSKELVLEMMKKPSNTYLNVIFNMIKDLL